MPPNSSGPKPYAAAQVLAAELKVLRTQAPARRHRNVLKARKGVERQLGANLRMAPAGHHGQSFRTQPLALDLLRERHEDIDRSDDHPGGKFALKIAELGSHATDDDDARSAPGDSAHQPIENGRLQCIAHSRNQIARLELRKHHAPTATQRMDAG